MERHGDRAGARPAPAVREAKPAWRSVPLELRVAIEAALGSRVVRARRAWGGFSSSATFVLTLEDGRSAFTKGTHPGQTAVGTAALDAEERVYREVEVIRPWAPGFLGSVRCG